MSDDNVTPIRPGVTAKSGRAKPGTKKGRKAAPESGAKAIAAVEKQAQAIALRKRGWNLARIATEVGYADPSGAYHAIQSALKTTLPDETRDEARRMELARLDALIDANWDAATLGNYVLDSDGEIVYHNGEPLRWGPSERAANVVLKCIGMRSRLQGLEEPMRVSVNVREGDAVEVDVLKLFTGEALEAALAVRKGMSELAALRAGAIEA